ncbi:2OG-Fe(II) oxygenase superfamily-domain-containing protein [Endogone sp. FLAS-F59071]|nr:2OG-Fe(II) oxygenase superfamily-domain-containing protein [Endogone sp. FLAS-F59071]|eukprot:RUS13343.1 2OG-Fe(II) oxygenase superfamily-domain-containing protein [Endogone sp. FLAS-F59071]
MTPASDMKKNDPDDPFRDGTARDDLTMWLHPGQVPTPGLSALAHFLSVTLKSDLHYLLHLANETEYQLAYYPPNGARYERHRDAFPTDDPADTQQRRVTSIVYLNPGWINGDGGELRLFARPAEVDGSDVDIEPVAGRLVVFLSGVVDHAVIGSGKQRFAITAWHR